MIPILLAVFRRRWPILVLIPVVTVIVVVLTAPSPKDTVPTYEGGIYLAANPGVTDAVRLQQAAIDLQEPDVATRAAENLGVEVSDPKRFTAPLRVRVDKDSLSMRLSVVDEDEEWAGQYPAAFAQAFLEITAERADAERLEELDILRTARDEANQELLDFRVLNGPAINAPVPDPVLQSQITSLQDAATQASNAYQAALADESPAPYRVQDADEVVRTAQTKLELPETASVRAGLAGILALVGAIGLAAFVERLNPRIDTPADAERILNAPVLAQVPIMNGKQHSQIERADLESFTGPFAESFRAMRSHLDFRAAAEELGRAPKVMVASSAPAEGKTTTTAFLALAYAEAGREVVVIGGDFRRPAIHRLFGVPRSPGLSSRVLSPDGEAEDDATARLIVRRDARTGVRVVPSGPGTSRVTALVPSVTAVTEAASETGCAVLIDTAPVMVANDAVDFLPLVDWVIVVVRQGRTTERSLRQTMASLDLNEAAIAGCVMVGSLEASDAKRYYYSYYKVDEEPSGAQPRPEEPSAPSTIGGDDEPMDAGEGDLLPTPAGDDEGARS